MNGPAGARTIERVSLWSQAGSQVAIWDPRQHRFITSVLSDDLEPAVLREHISQWLHLVRARACGLRVAADAAPGGSAYQRSLDRYAARAEEGVTLAAAAVVQRLGVNDAADAWYETQLCAAAWSGSTTRWAIRGTWLRLVASTYAVAVTHDLIGPALAKLLIQRGLDSREASALFSFTAPTAELRAILDLHQEQSDTPLIGAAIALPLRGYWRFLDRSCGIKMAPAGPPTG